MRPSIGRVARSPAFKIDRNLTVQGPMARNVEDLALLLDAMSGEHPADPLSLPALPASFLSAARSGKGPKRIAYSPDLGITRSIPKLPPSPERPRHASPRPAPLSRKRIRT